MIPAFYFKWNKKTRKNARNFFAYFSRFKILFFSKWQWVLHKKWNFPLKISRAELVKYKSFMENFISDIGNSKIISTDIL